MLDKFLSICHFPEVLFQHAVFREYLSGIYINAITELGLRMIMLNMGIIRKATRELCLDEVIIAMKGDVIWRVSMKEPDFNDADTHKRIQELKAIVMKSTNFADIDIESIDLSRPDLILTELYHLKYPAFIVFLGSEETAFYNPADAIHMSNAPASMFVRASWELNYPDELTRRNRLLRADKQLKDYAYKGLRWYWDGELWRKKEMSIIADYSICEYSQQSARFGIIKSEEELKKFVD